MNLERVNDILANWEELDWRLFVKAINKNRAKQGAAYIEVTDDIWLQLSVCLNDESSSEGELVQASVPWEYLKAVSGKSEDDIYQIALENTLGMFPPVCTELSYDFTSRLLDVDGDFRRMEVSRFMDPWVKVEKPESCLVVTNAGTINGASVMFLPGVKEKLADIVGSDLIVGFTSIHEAMVHPYDGVIGPSQVEEILQEETFRCEPDYLSSKVYIYERGTGAFHEYVGEKLFLDLMNLSCNGQVAGYELSQHNT